MRISPTALYGALILGITAAACGGGASGIQSSSGPVVTANGTVTLGSQQTVATLAKTGSYSTTITYLAGSGSVTATASTTVPPGVLPITQDPQATPSTAPVEYITLTGTAKMTGLPAIALTFAGTPATQYNDDLYNGTSWNIVSKGSIAEPIASFNSRIVPEDLTQGPVYIAIYTGPTVGEPPKSPPVCTAGNAICDPGFESGTYANYPAVPGTGSWTACTINPASSPLPHPASKYTPEPGTVPYAVINSFADSITPPNPAPTSVPTIPPVTPVHSGNFAAALGGQFNGYTLEDFAYNGLCQTVTIPQNATLSMYIYGAGNQGAAYADFDVDLLDTSENFVANLYDENVYPNDSAYRNVQLDMSPYGGQTVDLFIGLWGKGSGVYYGEYYFVDDMYLGINPPVATSSVVRRR